MARITNFLTEVSSSLMAPQPRSSRGTNSVPLTYSSSSQGGRAEYQTSKHFGRPCKTTPGTNTRHQTLDEGLPVIQNREALERYLASVGIEKERIARLDYILRPAPKPKIVSCMDLLW